MHDVDGQGNRLDVMRLSFSDTLYSTSASNSNANSYLNIDALLQSGGAYEEWRWATQAELEGISAFYNDSGLQFESINNGWSPKGDDTWTMLTPVTPLTNSSPYPAYGFNAHSNGVNEVTLRSNFNISGKGGAPAIVRDVPSDRDSDSDGVADIHDFFPLNPNESQDSDGDGVGDNADEAPNDVTRFDSTPPNLSVSGVQLNSL